MTDPINNMSIIGYGQVQGSATSQQKKVKDQGIRDKVMNFSRQIFSSMPKELKPLKEAIESRAKLPSHPKIVKERGAVLNFLVDFESNKPKSQQLNIGALNGVMMEKMIEALEMMSMSRGDAKKLSRAEVEKLSQEDAQKYEERENSISIQINNAFERTFNLQEDPDKAAKLSRFREAFEKHPEMAAKLNKALVEYRQALENHIKDPAKFTKGGNDLELLKAHNKLIQELVPFAGKDFAAIRQELHKQLPKEEAAQMMAQEQLIASSEKAAAKKAAATKDSIASLEKTATPLSNKLLVEMQNKKLTRDQANIIHGTIKHFNDLVDNPLPNLPSVEQRRQTMINDLQALSTRPETKKLILTLIDQFAK